MRKAPGLEKRETWGTPGFLVLRPGPPADRTTMLLTMPSLLSRASFPSEPTRLPNQPNCLPSQCVDEAIRLFVSRTWAHPAVEPLQASEIFPAPCEIRRVPDLRCLAPPQVPGGTHLKTPRALPRNDANVHAMFELAHQFPALERICDPR